MAQNVKIYSLSMEHCRTIIYSFLKSIIMVNTVVQVHNNMLLISYNETKGYSLRDSSIPPKSLQNRPIISNKYLDVGCKCLACHFDFLPLVSNSSLSAWNTVHHNGKHCSASSFSYSKTNVIHTLHK